MDEGDMRHQAGIEDCVDGRAVIAAACWLTADVIPITSHDRRVPLPGVSRKVQVGEK
jgi:hypothetical protein